MKQAIKVARLAVTSLAAMGITALAADETKADADNTKQNERDRSGETLTSGDQSSKPEDVKVTKDIRQAVVKDDSLSMMAKNVKIITIDGMVTLRGPVHSAEEKAKIESLAKSAAGSAKIDNQLEVKGNDKE